MRRCGLGVGKSRGRCAGRALFAPCTVAAGGNLPDAALFGAQLFARRSAAGGSGPSAGGRASGSGAGLLCAAPKPHRQKGRGAGGSRPCAGLPVFGACALSGKLLGQPRLSARAAAVGAKCCAVERCPPRADGKRASGKSEKPADLLFRKRRRCGFGAGKLPGLRIPEPYAAHGRLVADERAKRGKPLL